MVVFYFYCIIPFTMEALMDNDDENFSALKFELRFVS